MTTTTVGSYLTQRLLALGVRHVFGVTGDHVLGYGTERPMLDGPFNDVVPWRYAKVPEVLGAGRGYEVRTEGDLDDALAAALADRSGYSLLHYHIARGDLSPALQRMTSLMAERIR